MRLPFVVKAFAALCLITVAAEIWELSNALFRGNVSWRIAYSVCYVAIYTWLAVGLLRLQPVARVVALITCWIFFVGCGLIVGARIILGHFEVDSPLLTIPIWIGTVVLTVWLYITLRRAEVRELFQRRVST
jgi:hypothetical protein